MFSKQLRDLFDFVSLFLKQFRITVLVLFVFNNKWL